MPDPCGGINGERRIDTPDPGGGVNGERRIVDTPDPGGTVNVGMPIDKGDQGATCTWRGKTVEAPTKSPVPGLNHEIPGFETAPHQHYTSTAPPQHRTKELKPGVNIGVPDTLINKQISQNGHAIKNSNSTEVPKRERVPRGSRLTPERLAAMKIGNGLLSDAEKQLFIDILFEFEGAIAFTDSEMGLLDPSIELPVVIPTVPHEPWQQQNLRLPKAMEEAATEIVKEKLQHGLLEFSQGPYRSRYFLVEKKLKGAWRLINDVQQLNKITIHDSGMLPAVDEFSEDFAGYPITSVIDYYSGYYQIPLDKESCDLTAFLTMLGLVRMTRLPTG